MARSQIALLAAVLLALGPVSSVDAAKKKPKATAKKQARPDEGGSKVKVHEPEIDDKSPAQGYQGVTPQGGEPPETKPPPAGLTAVTWPGFKADSSGSEVFLQLTGQVSYTPDIKGQRVRITLDKTVVPLRNNLRPVITRNFKSPVASFRLKRAGKDRVVLDITLRRKAEPTVSLTNRGKFTFLVVAFPPA